MSTPSGSNVDSTHQNIEQLVQRIAALQKEEEATQKKLLAHEETRNEMCPGDYKTTTGLIFTTDHHTQYQTPCCSWEDESKSTGQGHMPPSDRGAPGFADAESRAPGGTWSFANVDDYNAANSVTTSLGNTHVKGQECLFKQNGADAYSQQLMDQIHRLANERAELFKTLLNIYANVQRDVAETRSDLVDQLTVVEVVEQELTNARSNLNALSGAKNNKNRMALINTYYGKRYQAHTGIMKMIIMICVPLLILAIVGKKGFIGDNITRPLALIVIIVGGFFLFQRIWDLSSRDNMNYDEYNWDFEPDSVKSTMLQYDKKQLDKSDIGDRISSDLHTLASDLGVECIGPNCCSKGMRYDQEQNRCVEDKGHHDKNAPHHRRAAADAKKQAEAFEVMRPTEGTSYVAPPGCLPMPSTVRPYASQDEEQYARVA
jgi:uncharacterized membrane-anchored protein YhcB (DUF1043 family)